MLTSGRVKCQSERLHRLLQANFPTTFARLPKLAVLDMKNNKFKCAPLPICHCWKWGHPVIFRERPREGRVCSRLLSSGRVCCRGELPNIRGMFSALRYFDISSNQLGGFIPQAWADTGIIRLVRSLFRV